MAGEGVNIDLRGERARGTAGELQGIGVRGWGPGGRVQWLCEGSFDLGIRGAENCEELLLSTEDTEGRGGLRRTSFGRGGHGGARRTAKNIFWPRRARRGAENCEKHLLAAEDTEGRGELRRTSFGRGGHGGARRTAKNFFWPRRARRGAENCEKHLLSTVDTEGHGELRRTSFVHGGHGELRRTPFVLGGRGESRMKLGCLSRRAFRRDVQFQRQAPRSCCVAGDLLGVGGEASFRSSGGGRWMIGKSDGSTGNRGRG